jgi:hypothetical protein
LGGSHENAHKSMMIFESMMPDQSALQNRNKVIGKLGLESKANSNFPPKKSSGPNGSQVKSLPGSRRNTKLDTPSITLGGDSDCYFPENESKVGPNVKSGIDPSGWAPGISKLTLQDATKNVEVQYFGAASQLDAGFGRHSKNLTSQLLGSNIGGGLYPITDGKADSIEENEYVEYGELEADPPRADREPSQGNPLGGKPGGNNFSGSKFQDGLLLEDLQIPTGSIKNSSSQDTNDLKSNAL